jgi:hypothetical protein
MFPDEQLQMIGGSWDDGNGPGGHWDIERLISDGCRVDAVLDVAVLCKGSLCYGYEMKWKHPVDEYKSEVLRLASKQGIEIYELDALRYLRGENANVRRWIHGEVYDS